jgi:hypothetical protein
MRHRDSFCALKSRSTLASLTVRTAPRRLPSTHFEPPVLDPSVLVFDIDVEPDMAIRPFDLRYASREIDGLIGSKTETNAWCAALGAATATSVSAPTGANSEHGVIALYPSTYGFRRRIP